MAEPLPNQYRPSRTDERLSPDQDPASHSGLADAWRLGWMGQLYDQVEENRAASRAPRTSDYDPLDHVPEGYEQYASAFLSAQNDAAIEQVRQNIDENLQIRARREARGFASTLLSDVGAGILDPQVLIAPQLRGVGLVRGALRGATILGGTGAATELIRGGLDPTSTFEETAAGVGFSFILGTGIGAIAGAIPAPRIAGAAPVQTPAERRASEGMFRDWTVLSVPGDARDGGRRRHAGYDLAPPAGRPELVADRPWRITRIGNGNRSGITAHVQFEDGTTWVLMHLRERPRQTQGTRGDIIAIAGNTGNARTTPTHFHAEGRDRNGNRLDPRQYFQMGSGSSPRASAAGADPIRTQSFLEGIDPPREVDLDGRGVRVVIGPTGRYDDAGNYIPAAHMPAREVPTDPLSVNEAPMPRTEVVEQEMPIAAAANDDDPIRVELPVAAEPPPVARSAAEAETRLVALEESDAAFFGALKDTPLYREAAERGLHNLSLRKRGQLATALADELEGDEAALRALFGGEVPRKVTAKAIRERLNFIAKERVKLELEGSKVQRGRVRTDEEIESPQGRPDSGWVQGPDGIERWVGPEPARFDTMDEALFEMRQMDFRRRVAASLREQADNATSEKVARILRKRAEQVENGEVPARGIVDDVRESPYTAERSAGDDPSDIFDEHIRIDVDAIIASFDDKPWTTPRVPGVDPLPADAFRNPSEWLNFVFLHEREHIVNPRKEGESLVDFENRTNARAMEELRAGQMPFSPERSRMEKVALAPTPIGQLMRLVPEDAQIMRDIQDLAGDMATTLMANRGGGAASAGGSVFQRTLRWIATTAELRLAIRQQWLRYVQGDAPASAKMTEVETLAARLPLIGAASRKGKMSLRDFRDQVGRAQISDDLDVVPEARVAARVLNNIFQRFELEARQLGVFERTQNVKRLREGFERRAQALEERIRGQTLTPAVRADLDAMITTWRNEAAALADVEAQPVMPRGESRYFPRIWNTGVLRDRKDEAITLLRNAYMREGSTPEKADLQAKGAYDAMIGEPNADFLPSRPTSSRSRTVPLTNQEAVDFIVQDPELILGIYSRRTGAAIEMTRRFGDPGGLDHEDELLADLLLRGVDRDKAQGAMQIWRDMRDRIAGGFHGMDPMSWNNRAARFLKNTASLAVMGKVIYSQIVDIARVIGTVGPRPLWKSLVGVMSGDLARYNVGPYAKQAGEALDLVLARTTARMIESDDAILVTRDSGIERAVAGAQAPFFVANLMIPFTVIMKEWTSLAAGHIIIDEARLVSRAIQAGEAPDPVLVSRLAGIGIDRQDVQLLASMPFETTDGGLHLANVNAWEGAKGQRARDLFLGAVSGEVRRGIITPGPLDKPAILDGVVHVSRGREKGLQRVEAARQAADDAYQAIVALRRSEAPEDAVQEAVARLSEARAELSMARRSLGRAGRKEMPLASLPLQLKSFVLAAGGKLLHGLLSNRDRAKAAGLLSLMVGGVLSTYLKSAGTGRWDYMEWPEIAMDSFNNSGMGAYLSDIGQAVDNSFHLVGDDVPGIQDEVGAIAGVAPGLVAGLFEAFVSDDMTDARRAGAIRRVLPLNNLIWWDRTVRRLSMAAISGDETSLSSDTRPVRQDVPIGMLSDIPDLRSRPDLFVAEDEPADPMAADIDALVDAYERDVAPRLRKGRTRNRRRAGDLVEAGNIDLSTRPVVRNPDGSVSTVLSMSIGTERGEVLIPRVSDDGRVLGEDEAVALYRQTGRHLGIFRNAAAATQYAESLHRSQEDRIAGSPATGRRQPTRNRSLYRAAPLPDMAPR